MARYYFRVDYITRSKNRNAVKNAAYICGNKMYDERNQKFWNFEEKADRVALYETVYPKGSKHIDLSLWNAAEKFEDLYALKRYITSATQEKYRLSAVVAMTIIMTLPNELNVEENKKMVREFIDERFTQRNLVTTYAIHNNPNNIHAHLLITRRPINEQGDFAYKKDQELCSPKEFHATRKLFADIVNNTLEQHGVNIRISEQSYAKRGIKLIPQKYLGYAKDDKLAWINQEIARKNEQRILRDPEIFLDFLNKTLVNITQQDAIKQLKRYVSEPEQIEFVLKHIFKEEYQKADQPERDNNTTQVQHKEFIDKISHIEKEQYMTDELDTPLSVQCIYGIYHKFKSSELDPLYDSLSEEDIIKNSINKIGYTIFSLNSQQHKTELGYGFSINHTMIKDYINHFHLDIPFNQQYAEFASFLADHDQLSKDLNLTETAKHIRQVLCFEILKEINKTLKSPYDSSTVLNKATELSEHINKENIWILNNRKLMTEALIRLQPNKEYYTIEQLFKNQTMQESQTPIEKQFIFPNFSHQIQKNISLSDFTQNLRLLNSYEFSETSQDLSSSLALCPELSL